RSEWRTQFPNRCLIRHVFKWINHLQRGKVAEIAVVYTGGLVFRCFGCYLLKRLTGSHSFSQLNDTVIRTQRVGWRSVRSDENQYMRCTNFLLHALIGHFRQTICKSVTRQIRFSQFVFVLIEFAKESSSRVHATFASLFNFKFEVQIQREILFDFFECIILFGILMVFPVQVNKFVDVDRAIINTEEFLGFTRRSRTRLSECYYGYAA